MKSNLATLTAFLVACGGIQINPTDPSLDPPSPVDPSTPVNPPAPDQCQKMCERLTELGCEEGQAVYDSDRPGPADVPNTSCADFCRTSEKAGAMLNPACVKTVSSCDQIEEYRARDSETCLLGAP